MCDQFARQSEERSLFFCPEYIRMFANCEKLKEDAREIVKVTDRMMYWPFLAHIEKFAKENGCYLAGELAISRFSGECTEGFCDAAYELYCDSVFPTGQRLADELYSMDSPFLASSTICLQTILKHRELVLSINARVLVRLYGMERIRGRKLPFVLPTGMYLPIEALIVGIYRKLYTPCEASKWKMLLKTEAAIFTKWREGKTYHDIGAEPGMANLHRAIMSRFYEKSSPGILAGDFGLNLLAPCETRRLQFISNMTNDDLVVVLRKALTVASMAHHITRIRYSESSIVCFSDIQLTMTTFYAETTGRGGPGYALCDVWNSTQYELIPTMRGVASADGDRGPLVAHPLVLLKLFFVDAWVAMINGRKIPTGLIDNILIARYYLVEHPENALPRDYLGQIITDRAAKKRAIDEEYRLPDYLPATRDQS